MTQPQLFGMLLVTGVMVISGIREIGYRHYAMGALLCLVPIAGWISMWLGHP